MIAGLGPIGLYSKKDATALEKGKATSVMIHDLFGEKLVGGTK